MEGTKLVGAEPVLPQQSKIFAIGPQEGPVYDDSAGPYLPLWQLLSPPPWNGGSINLNYLEFAARPHFNYIMDTKLPARSPVVNLNIFLEDGIYEPVTIFYQPAAVFRDFSDAREVVAIIQVMLPLRKYFESLLHDDHVGIICVVKNTCGQAFSFKVDGPETTLFLGEEDLHNASYDYLEDVTGLTLGLEAIAAGNSTSAFGVDCAYTLHVYPSDEELREKYETSTPLIFPVAVVSIFLFTSMVFVLYDCLVQRRQSNGLRHPYRHHRIVTISRSVPRSDVQSCIQRAPHGKQDTSPQLCLE